MTEHERRELEPPAPPLKRGDSGPKVRQVQEWLTLHGFGTAIDGDFGPATEAAIKAFQQQYDGEDEVLVANSDGVVGGATWRALTAPMREVVEWKRDPPISMGREVAFCARAHLYAHPREVDGPNAGPWVRLYMDGHEGKDWPWCAGFATYVLRQALGHDKWDTFDCDELAAKAHARGLLVHHPPKEWHGPEHIKPGDLFLTRNTERWPHNWTHCGIVTAVGSDYFETIEGNTNQGGSREGTEVCKRVRAFKPNVDFVLTGGDRT